MTEFDQFWMSYPRKVGKLAAAKAYAVALHHHAAADILAGLQVYRQHLPDDLRFIPLPTTWLNQGRWMDEYDAPARAPREDRSTCAHNPTCISNAWHALQLVKDRNVG